MPRHPQGNVFYRDMGHDYPTIEWGDGSLLFDSSGKAYIDASGGPLVVNIGHGVRSVPRAMADQAGSVAYVHGSLFTTEAIETYSSRLAAHVPMEDPRFYFLCTGSEAVEAAVKLARQLQTARGELGRYLVVSRWGSYHGATLGALAVSGKPAMRDPYAPLFRDMPHIAAPYCYRCALGLSHPGCGLACAHQLEDEIQRQGVDKVAAFLAEPVGGATQGAVVPPDGYWPLIREICSRYSVLLIADEVLTGFGRTGTWFAMEQWGVEPDVICMGKGATGGYSPLSLVAVCGRDVETIRQAHGTFNHGGTFSHHAVGAAAALSVLDYLERRRLVARARQVGADLGKALLDRLADLPAVGDVRGIGMMWAVELVADKRSREPLPAAYHAADRVARSCMEAGVLLYPGHGGADGKRGDHLMVAPPYVVSHDQISRVVETLAEAILEVRCP